MSTIIETSHVKKHIGPATVINGVTCVTGDYILTDASGVQSVTTRHQLKALKMDKPAKQKPPGAPETPPGKPPKKTKP